MNGYDAVAAFYDRFNADYDPAVRYAYLCRYPEFSGGSRNVLDLCCGTGDMSIILAEAGHSVVSVDISENMLSVAQSKAAKRDVDLLLLCQDATKLDLYGTVFLTVCMQDSLNHLPSRRAFDAAVGRVALFTEKGGLFAFDLNTEYKHREILADNCFVDESDGCLCIWESECGKNGDVVSRLRMFNRRTDGLFERRDAEIRERLFPPDFVEESLNKHGFTIRETVDGDRYEPLSADSQRILYFAERI